MEYNDSALAKISDFEKMARAYSRQTKKKDITSSKEINPALIDNIMYTLKYLEWVYYYTKKRVNSNKIKNIFNELETRCSLDYIKLENTFFDKSINIRINKTRRLKSLSSCVKVAIYSECELLENLIKLYQCDENLICFDLIINNILNIKKLASF